MREVANFGIIAYFYRVASMFKKGFVIKDKYELISELGKGGSSIVWEAFDRDLKEAVAIKFLPPKLLSYSELVSQIKARVERSTSLSHPNIVKVFEYNEFEGIPFIVMEKVGKGETLDQLIRQKGKFSLDEVLNFLRLLADALQYAQGKGILHEDLRPQNILLTEDGTLKIKGFGYEKKIREVISTIIGADFKRPYFYQPPEHMGLKHTGPYSDVYSLGMITFEMLSNKHPYEGLDPVWLYHCALVEELSVDGEIPDKVGEVIKKALSKYPESRYQNPKEFFKEFENAVKKLSTLSGVSVVLPEKPKLGEIWKDPYHGMEFVYVGGGSFDMGDLFEDEFEEGLLVHKVELDGFWIGRYPVTVGQWKRFVRDIKQNGVEKFYRDYDDLGFIDIEYPAYPEYHEYGDSYPVVYISWYDAKAFARWLSEKTGYKFRLPTEAQWEYACRSGGKKQKYSSSIGAISHEVIRFLLTQRNLLKSGSFAPNRLGIYDMGIYVYEWCEDEYKKEVSNQHALDGLLCADNDEEEKEYRVVCGFPVIFHYINYPCCFRMGLSATRKDNDIGFRLVVDF